MNGIVNDDKNLHKNPFNLEMRTMLSMMRVLNFFLLMSFLLRLSHLFFAVEMSAEKAEYKSWARDIF